MSTQDRKPSTRPVDRAKCERSKCTYVARTRGLCAKHYTQELKLRTAAGQWIPGIVDPQPMRDHVAALRGKGLGLRRIADLAGVHVDGLRHSLRRTTVYAYTAARVMSVPIPATAIEASFDGARVAPIGTARRLQALIALGHSQRSVAARLGMEETNLSALVYGKQGQVSAGTARRVAAVFDQMAATPGNCSRSLNRAAKQGWVPPLAWDDDIDDPAARPYTEKTEGTVTPISNAGSRAVGADFLDIVEDWRGLGRSDEEIAERFGIKLDTFYTRLRRLVGTAQRDKAC